MALEQIVKNPHPPVFLCIGSDLAIGDSHGPICGTMLAEKKEQGIFVYGTLRQTVTAKEVQVGRQAVLGRQSPRATPRVLQRHA